jgi:UDP-4-amino-4,6-dideoxy-N-acetyl-beta-L-altrosamine transaminase
MEPIPYSRQDIDDDDVAAVVAALRSDWLTQGPAVPAFEAAFAARHQVAHAVAVTNATAALQLACLALGVGAGSRVWTSPNSFVASATAALHCGATVDFVDIDPATRNLSVAALEDKLRRADAAGTLPQLLVPVDFAGLPCDLREMRVLADRYGFAILEDASHATGAAYLGAPVGSAFADATVFSFHAVKVLTTGEGGMVTTQDAAVAERVRALRSHGITRDASTLERPSEGGWSYEHQTLGFNCRMTDLQAALGLSQLARLDTMQARRAALADRYDTLLAALPLQRPARAADKVPAWHLYCVEIDTDRPGSTRAEVFQALRDAEIGVNVHYIPIHSQPFFERLGFRRGDFPQAERYYSRCLSLPLFPALTAAQQARVVDGLRTRLT